MPPDSNTPSIPNINVENIDQAQKALAAATAEAEKLGLHGSDAIVKLNVAFDAMVKKAQESSRSFSVLSAASELSNRAQLALNETVKKSGEGLSHIGKVSQDVASNIGLIGTALLGPAKILQNIGGDSSLDTISGQIGEIINNAKGASAPIMALAKQLGVSFNPNLKTGMFGPLIQDIQNVGAAIDKSINMERAVYNMSAQSGQLNTLFNATGKGLKDLSVVAMDYTHALDNVRKATGSTAEQMDQYFNSIKNLPAASQDNADSTQLVSNQMGKLQSILNLAKGTGQEFGDVLTQTRTILETYNGTADQAYDITARSAELSKNYGATISMTNGFLTSMADSFKLLGDNTEGASGIFDEMFKGLRDGGLGMKPAIDTIGQMTESIAHLSVAQKAFISSRSGGPGGLLGSIQIEKELASGGKGAQDVFEKLRKSFTQQAGGHIITRDEVQTQQQAAQFEKQRQLLMSPAFGGVAKTEEQASAILKAFSEANKGKAVAKPGDLLHDTMQQGNDYQKLSATNLTHISATLDDILAAGGFGGAKVFQESLTGASGKGAIAAGVNSRREAAGKDVGMPLTGMDQGEKYAKAGLSSLKGDIETVAMSGKQLAQEVKNRISPSETEQATATTVTRPGAALHNAARTATYHTTGHPPAAHTTPTHPAYTAPTTANNPITNVNVYIDGKKIVPDQVQTSHSGAIGPRLNG